MTEDCWRQTPERGKPATRRQCSWLKLDSPRLIFLVAFTLRIVAMSVVHTWPLDQGSSLWKSGPEIVNIASALAGHRGFSSPFGVESGPTAWIPPLYPALAAAIFKLFGLRSNVAAITILSIQALFSALICIPLYAIAKQAFNKHTATWAAWGWAIFPYAVLTPVLFVWETSVSGLLLVVLCYASMNLSLDDRRSVILLGSLWAVAALTNTALLAVMPVFLLVPYLNRRAHFPYKAIVTVILVSAFLASPWILRTYRALGAIVPVRSNFGEELWVGNHAGGMGRMEYGIGPADNASERERFRRAGELAYVAQRRSEAMRFIRENPLGFVQRTFFRFRYWWFAEGETAPLFILYRALPLIAFTGILLALSRISGPPVLTIIASIVIYPLVYYVTDVYARYRYPIEPFLMLFAGFAISRLVALRKRS